MGLFRRNKNNNKPVIRQILDLVPRWLFESCTNTYKTDKGCIAELYKKRWDIELFFKALKQNLQVKTFLETSENAVKSQIYVALINYLLLELIKRTISKIPVAFSNLSEKSDSACITIYHWITYAMRSGRVFAKLPSQPKKK